MFIGTAYAQDAAAAANPILQFVPIILIFLVFYFLIIRPQQKRAKQHREMIGAVRRSDTVVTSGGVVGKVTKVDETEIEVEIAKDVRVKVVKSTLADVRSKTEPANDAS